MALWRAEFDPTVLPCATADLAADPIEAFDLGRLPHRIVVIRDSGGERVLIGDSAIQIRLDVRLGTVLQGPVVLKYDLWGATGVEAKLLTLRRLLGLARAGVGLDRRQARDPQAARWALALRALDARRAGATHREIADALFGETRVAADWRGRSDYLRSRLQRLIRNAERAVHGDYRKFLQWPQ